MTVKYECDITGKQYNDEDKLSSTGLTDGLGLVDEFDFGPDATINEVRERLHSMIDEWEPHHDDWWDSQTDTYCPPRIVREAVSGEYSEIIIPTVVKQ